MFGSTFTISPISGWFSYCYPQNMLIKYYKIYRLLIIAQNPKPPWHIIWLLPYSLKLSSWLGAWFVASKFDCMIRHCFVYALATGYWVTFVVCGRLSGDKTATKKLKKKFRIQTTCKHNHCYLTPPALRSLTLLDAETRGARTASHAVAPAAETAHSDRPDPRWSR